MTQKLKLLLTLSLLTSHATLAALPSIVLSPSAIRTQLLKGNLSLDEAEKRVEDAKNQVGLARAGLFPSLNVGAIFNGNFVISSIDFLVPFLIPGNWFQLDQNKHLFEAEKHSYKALELNTFSSALSLYFNIRSDFEVAQAYSDQAKDLRQIADFIHKTVQLGIASPEDERSALGTAETAEGQAARAQAAVNKETAALRQALGLSLDTQIVFSDLPSDGTLPPSELESAQSASEIRKMVEKALAIAPEHHQIDALVAAAQEGSWSRVFGWINSASVSAVSPTPGASALVSHFVPKVSVSLGLALYPAIELSNRNVEEVKLRYVELEQEFSQTLEGGIHAKADIQAEYEHFSSAESQLNDVYQYQLKRYGLGIASLYDVLLAHRNLTSAKVSRIQAQLDLTLLRVTLHRTLLTDEFAQISGCNLEQNTLIQKKSGVARWFSSLFGSSDENGVSLLELCKKTEASIALR